jgi:ribosomal protein L7/L12
MILIGTGLWVTGRQRSRDDIPADVIGLVAGGQKIHAIKRYRELTGASLPEAKAVIDGL